MELNKRRAPRVQLQMPATMAWLFLRPYGVILQLLLLGTFAGCGKHPYELAPVSGTVTIDGQPVTQANVMFAPIAKGEKDAAGKPAFGSLGPDGHFVLTTYDEADGAVIGEHWVTIIHVAEQNNDWPAPKTAEKPNKTSAKNPKFSRITVPRTVNVVADQDNHIDIQLKADEVARFSLKAD